MTESHNSPATRQHIEKTPIEAFKDEVNRATAMRYLPVDSFAREDGHAYRLAKAFGDDLKATQLRRFFGVIKHAERHMRSTVVESKESVQDATAEAMLDDQTRTNLALLMPVLAYAKARKLIPGGFYDIMKMCMGPTRLKSEADLERFTQFMEALVAYHKLFEKGSRDHQG